jgi:hypothetical protein
MRVMVPMSATATQRRATQPAPAAAPRPIPREFPVRFTPTLGLKSLLQTPPNSFSWIGAGAVLVDQHSLRITARRLTMLGLRRTVGFVHQSEIRGVYREGNAVRIDLLDERRRSYFYFWAEDAESAGEIVQRLPTTSTVELEGEGQSVWEDPPRRLPRPVLWAAAGVVLIAGLIWAGGRLLAPAPKPETASSQHARAAQPVPMLISATRARTVVVADLGTRSDLEKFTRRFDALALQFSVASDALQSGELNQTDFADGLERWLAPQWKVLSGELSLPPVDKSALRTSTDAQLQHVIDSWTQALALYEHGLRYHDYREVLRAFDAIRDAEDYERQSRALLLEFEEDR